MQSNKTVTAIREPDSAKPVTTKPLINNTMRTDAVPSESQYKSQERRPRCPANWPHADHSRLVRSGGIDWHVQEFTRADDNRPVVFLLHGTGASTHSWRDVITQLTDTYHVVACDLPGHGFTTRPRNSGMSLTGMARLIAGLLDEINVSPDYLVGHSAGSALCCQLVLEQNISARGIVSINGALMPFDGLAGQFFAPIANLLALNPVVPRLVSWRAKRSNLVQKLITDTGSTLDAKGLACYAELLRRKEHISGALSMMANWELVPLWRKLPHLDVPLYCVVGTGDRTVPPQQADEVCRQVSHASMQKLPTLGHLAHEEAPEEVALLLHEYFQWHITNTGQPLPASNEVASPQINANTTKGGSNINAQDSVDNSNRRHPL